jgi:hypothetical protein
VQGTSFEKNSGANYRSVMDGISFYIEDQTRFHCHDKYDQIGILLYHGIS